MKPHINPIVIDISDDNIMQVMTDVIAECNKYSAYPIGKKHISIVPICLDTETTTIEKDGEQYAFTWIYQIQIGKYCLLIPKKYQLLLHTQSFERICRQRKDISIYGNS